MIAKDPALASSAATWRGSSNVFGTTGVIPVSGKRETMISHARRCVNSDKAVLQMIEARAALAAEAKARAKASAASLAIQQNTENIAPLRSSETAWFSPAIPSVTHIPPTYILNAPFTVPMPASPASFAFSQNASPSPYKRIRTSLSESNIFGANQMLTPLPSNPLPHHSTTSTIFCHAHGCNCECHRTWDQARQDDFAANLCNLFVACNFSFNAAENPQTHLFFAKWIPGAKVPDRRKLSGPCLDTAVTHATRTTRTAVFGQYATGQSDGWKNIAKTSVLTSTMNVNWLVRTSLILI